MKILQNQISVKYDRNGKYAVTHFGIGRDETKCVSGSVEVTILKHGTPMDKVSAVVPLENETDSVDNMLSAARTCIHRLREQQANLINTHDAYNIIMCVKDSVERAIADGRFIYSKGA